MIESPHENTTHEKAPLYNEPVENAPPPATPEMVSPRKYLRDIDRPLEHPTAHRVETITRTNQYENADLSLHHPASTRADSQVQRKSKKKKSVPMEILAPPLSRASGIGGGAARYAIKRL